MKKTIVLLFGLFLLFGCSSPQSVAEKALKEIGDGKYKSSLLGVNYDITSLNEKLFTKCYAYDSYGEEFTKTGGFSSEVLDSWDVLGLYFDVNTLFNDIKYVETKGKSRMNIYGFEKKLPENGENADIYRDLNETVEKSYAKEWENFRSNDRYMAGLMYKNIPCYELKYKLDNRYIAEVMVLKLPKVGYRVGYVNILR